MPIYRLENVIQPYAWGSRTAIAQLLGLPSPSHTPQAEMWMGIHPKGPSLAVADGVRISLKQLIEQRPVEILGANVADRFDNTLPYLFKVLAAERPLSIQAHPNKKQAEAGFSAEEEKGVPRDAPNRNYRDDNHKPEIICAVTPFWGLNGFRSPEDAAELIEPVCPAILRDALGHLRNQPDGLQSFFAAMMTLSPAQCERAATELRTKAAPMAEASPVYRWIVVLSQAYPADMGALSPALLNLICLDPGQAMYLPAGQLHAYLDGVGIELMANSDNVLRGGLTPKHVDVEQLLCVVRFETTRIDVLHANVIRNGESIYQCPASEFVLGVIHAHGDRPYRSPSKRSVEMLLCTSGNGRIEDDRKRSLAVKKGDSFLIPASLQSYCVTGDLTLYKAAVPRKNQ